MAVEQTLILAKPDAVRRWLAGEIVARFERRGFTLRAARLLVVDRALGESHYAEHAAKPFFGEVAVDDEQPRCTQPEAAPLEARNDLACERPAHGVRLRQNQRLLDCHDA